MENTLLNFTPQLYYYNSQNHLPEQIASGVLFTFNSDHFLITAKHVFNNIKISEVIIFLNDDNVVQLSGPLGYFINVKQYDNLDIAILKLNDEISEKIKQRYSFLHYKNIDFSHIYIPTNIYMLLGFINKQTKLKGRNFSSTPFGFLTQIKPLKKIHELGLTSIENITLTYNRRQQTFLFDNAINFGPEDLTGLSGGGIWHCRTDANKSNKNRCCLVGIMIEQLSGTNRGVIVGTKINLVLEILSKYFGILI